jgi:hypothetical protein
MERSVAVKKLMKMLGKSFGYRIDTRAPTPEERAAAQAEMPAAVAERNKIKEQKDARYRAILAADQEYQSLCVAYDAARKRTDKLFSLIRHYKITVGNTNSMFFHIKAEGDSWEEVIDKLQEKAAA